MKSFLILFVFLVTFSQRAFGFQCWLCDDYKHSQIPCSKLEKEECEKDINSCVIGNYGGRIIKSCSDSSFNRIDNGENKCFMQLGKFDKLCFCNSENCNKDFEITESTNILGVKILSNPQVFPILMIIAGTVLGLFVVIGLIICCLKQ